MKKHLWLFILFTLVLSACSVKKLPGNLLPQPNGTSSEQTSDQTVNKGLRSFANLEELRQFVSKTASGGLGGGREMMALDAAVPAGAMAKASAAAPVANAGGASEQSLKYSETNNQVKGVDEPDIAKTNGKLLFYANNAKVDIVQAYPPADAKILKTLDFDGSVNNLFLFNNKLVVYGTPNNFVPASASTTEAKPDAASAAAPSARLGKIAMPIWRNSNYTFLKVYDIAEPSAPNLVTDLTFEGNAFDARLIDNHLYLITNKYAYNIADGDILPLIYKKSDLIADKTFPSVHYFNFPYQSYSFTSVNAIDLNQDDAAPAREIYLLNGNESIYASKGNLYIASTQYLNEQDLMIKKTREIIFDRLPQKDQDLIRQIDGLDEAILSKDEKSGKIYSLIMKYSSTLTEAEQQQIGDQVKNAIKAEHPRLRDELVSTTIHKIKLDGLTLAYQGQAQVPGRLLNQFSMDESGDYFRIATTRDQTWSQILDNQQLEADNSLYVLDKDMSRVGALENLAPKERIYSARFLGDRAYLVTFVQTDPLFVIDLKNPTEPKVLGELKIPGFSNYLHPINETTLIGLGKNTETNEWGGVVPTSLKLALFDVSDPADPKVLDEKTLGNSGSDSAALYDHKAFLYDDSSKTLAIPVNLMGKSDNRFGYGNLEFNGSVVFNLTDLKLNELGKIDHRQPGENRSSFDYSNGVRRNLIIEGNIYTLSQNLMKINALAGLKELNELKFADQQPTPIIDNRLFKGGVTEPVRINAEPVKAEPRNVLP
jgi:uncharacterized secreted protein with C-terminal beta-propeller domain